MLKYTQKKSRQVRRFESNSTIFITIPILVVILGIVGYTLINRVSISTNMKNISFIKERMDANYNMNDFSNQVSMNDPNEDIKYDIRNGNITIYFGNISMTYDEHTFASQQAKDELALIGLTYTYTMDERNHVTGVTLYFKGKEIY